MARPDKQVFVLQFLSEERRSPSCEGLLLEIGSVFGGGRAYQLQGASPFSWRSDLKIVSGTSSPW